MPTRQEILAALDGELDYPAIGRRFGIHPGLAYLIATGVPADGSDVLTEEENERPGMLAGSSQHLANPPAHGPDAHDSVARWLRSRVQGDAQMQAALRSRTATPGPVHDEGEATDVLTVLVRQHDQVVALVKQIQAIPGVSKGGDAAQASQREAIIGLITELLAAHETAEQKLLWPHVRRVLAGGDGWADAAITQEQEATETLHALAEADAQTEEFDQLVGKLMPQLHKHVALEDRVFMQLREAMPQDERQELGRQIMAAQQHAPIASVRS